MTADIRMALENELDQLDEAQVEDWLQRCFDACDPRYDSDWLNGIFELALMQFPENYEVRAAASRAATMEAQRLYDEGEKQEAVTRLERLLENDPYCTEAFELLEKFMQGTMSTEEMPPAPPAPEPVAPEPEVAPVAPAAEMPSEVVAGDDDLLGFLNENVLDGLGSSQPELPADTPAAAETAPTAPVHAAPEELDLQIPDLNLDEPIPALVGGPGPVSAGEGASAQVAVTPAVPVARSLEAPPEPLPPPPMLEEPAPEPTVAPTPAPQPVVVQAPAEPAPTPAPVVVQAPPAVPEPSPSQQPARTLPAFESAEPVAPAATARVATANGTFDWRSVVSLPAHGHTQLEPQLEAILPNLTERFLQAGNYRSLVVLLTDLFQRDPSHAGLRNTLNGALRDWSAQLERSNRGNEAGQVAAWARQLLGDTASAWADAVTQRHPAALPALPDLTQYGSGANPAWMGWVNVLRDKPERAAEAAQALGSDTQALQSLFRHLAVHHPNEPDHVLNLGWAYSVTGQHALAMVHTQRALQLKASAKGYQLLQKIYSDLGQPDMAQRVGQQLAQLKA